MAWDILLVLTSVAGNLCNKCPSGYSNKTAVKVILSMWSLVSIEQQSPRRPCDITLCVRTTWVPWIKHLWTIKDESCNGWMTTLQIHLAPLQIGLGYYRPQRSWGKVMFLQACVILFTSEVCLSACWDIPPWSRPSPEQAPLPQEQTTPPTSRHPLAQSMLEIRSMPACWQMSELHSEQVWAFPRSLPPTHMGIHSLDIFKLVHLDFPIQQLPTGNVQTCSLGLHYE